MHNKRRIENVLWAQEKKEKKNETATILASPRRV